MFAVVDKTLPPEAGYETFEKWSRNVSEPVIGNALVEFYM